MSNLILSLENGKIAYTNKKGGHHDYIDPNAPKSVLLNRLHTIYTLRRGAISPLLRMRRRIKMVTSLLFKLAVYVLRNRKKITHSLQMRKV